MSKKVEVSIKEYYGISNKGYTEILRFRRDIPHETSNVFAFMNIENLLGIIANASVYYGDKDCIYCAYQEIHRYLTQTGGLGVRGSCPSEKQFPFTYKFKQTGHVSNCLMEVKVINT